MSNYIQIVRLKFGFWFKIKIVVRHLIESLLDVLLSISWKCEWIHKKKERITKNERLKKIPLPNYVANFCFWFGYFSFFNSFSPLQQKKKIMLKYGIRNVMYFFFSIFLALTLIEIRATLIHGSYKSAWLHRNSRISFTLHTKWYYLSGWTNWKHSHVQSNSSSIINSRSDGSGKVKPKCISAQIFFFFQIVRHINFGILLKPDITSLTPMKEIARE